MFGRSWCLLGAGFVISGSAFIAGQADSSGRVAPRFLYDAPSGEIRSGRIVHPFRTPLPPPRVFGLPQVVRAAGTIFSGTVTKIERRPATAGQSVETVAVTFRVENALRGATPGQDLTITQWIGLWASGQRYRLGERVVLFLYPASKLGLTSCVGGALGRFAVDHSGWVLLTARHLAAFGRDPVLGGKSRARFGDFALAVRHAGEEE
ncbi:MAG TPA: hypothetical protein VJP02_10870 [Candidatus Sulfotelmatobacter sp.]|nr:hypothetical protein [Candidatus Sulfotelmatobacter sp.]